MPLFENFLDEMGIRYEQKKSEKMYIVRGKTRVIFRSLDAPDKMRSVEIGSLYIDELAYADEYAFKTFLGRLRDKKGSMRLRAATTPNGFNFVYVHFVEGLRKIVYMSTYENKHLPESYIEDIESSYDSEMRKQELEGEFINIGSTRTYYQFLREKNVADLGSIQAGFEGRLDVGMDFNVNPMTAVIGAVMDDKLYIFSERFLKNSNTFQMRDNLKESYGNDLLIVPDSTGRARKTSAAKSDHELLKEYFTVARAPNPPRKDRFNCVNNLLEKGKLIIDKSCVNLIKDMDRFDDSGKDDQLGHISDALGYLAWYYFLSRESTKILHQSIGKKELLNMKKIWKKEIAKELQESLRKAGVQEKVTAAQAEEVWTTLIDSLLKKAITQHKAFPIGKVADIYFSKVEPRKIRTPFMENFKRTRGGHKLKIKNRVKADSLEKEVLK